MKLPKVIYVMGAPGSGKGTQAELLAHKIHYHRFSTGDAFRAMARQDTPLGRRVHETIHGQGLLMPPEDAAAVVINAIRQYVKDDKGIVFDGTPRTLGEAAMVDEFFAKNGYGRPLAIYLAVSQEDMIARNSKRRFCLAIDNDFPVVTDADAQRCAQLGGRVGVREDDLPEKIGTRWQEFATKTAPVVQKYKADGILQEVDGRKSIEDVNASVMKIIEDLQQ